MADLNIDVKGSSDDMCRTCTNVAICKFVPAYKSASKAFLELFERLDNPKGSMIFLNKDIKCRYFIERRTSRRNE